MAEIVRRAHSRGHDALAVAALVDGESIFLGRRRNGLAIDDRTLFEIGSIT